MLRAIGSLIKLRLLRIAESEATFRVRGFHASNDSSRRHLETVGRAFLQGYHAALEASDVARLNATLDRHDVEYRGFAYEGAAMAYGLLDSLSLRRPRRWNEFLTRFGDRHRYVLHVGCGWAVARLPWRRRRLDAYLERFDPWLKWLVVDGYGFHEGYFSRRPEDPGRIQRPQLKGYALRAFDQGFGRSLWFVAGADVLQIQKLIETFPLERRGDLWSGIGIACCYAGNPIEEEVESLLDGAGSLAPHFRQGVTFGAEARVLGEVVTPNTELVCRCACGMSSEEAARLARAAKSSASRLQTGDDPYELWRSEIRRLLASRREPVPN
jgi:hypothetical protein